ncbi:MAG: pyridoxal phosphate-dependent aminotransferase [Deltaproteobacteria bacterium]|nr:pyridoxal phosphate-dependent aminotransferase [Deltaproteobacteria bacterium]MBW2072386.1 pyridoxal phosphate-dependent aminotransferase [Deltaproteobacteria bacterium]
MSPGRSALVAAGKRFRTEGISRRVRQITVSAIKEMPLLAEKVGGCVSLGQGIPSFATPPHIVEAVCRFLRDSATSGKYTLGPGLPELREAIAGEILTRHGVAFDPDREICITAGAMEGLLAAILTVVERGDEVILPSPNYASHIEQVLMAEGEVVFAPLAEDGWRLDLERLQQAMSSRTRAMILCNPHNPTGAHFPEEDVRSLAELLLERQIIVICDETYDFLTYDGADHFSLLSIPELKDQVIATFSFSKKYAMTGWRVGAVVTSEGLLDQIMKVHDAAVICAPTPSQYAALAALEGPQDCVAFFRQQLQQRRDLICRRLDELQHWFSYVKPQGAYYLMVRYLDQQVDSMSYALELLREARVITIPGGAFGPTGEGHLRLSFGGTEEELHQAMDRIQSWLEKR